MAAEFEQEIEARKAGEASGEASGWWQEAVEAPGANDTEGGHEFESEADADSATQPSNATRRSRTSRISRRSAYQPSEATSMQDDQSETSSRRDWW